MKTYEMMDGPGGMERIDSSDARGGRGDGKAYSTGIGASG